MVWRLGFVDIAAEMALQGGVLNNEVWLMSSESTLVPIKSPRSWLTKRNWFSHSIIFFFCIIHASVVMQNISTLYRYAHDCELRLSHCFRFRASTVLMRLHRHYTYTNDSVSKAFPMHSLQQNRAIEYNSEKRDSSVRKRKTDYVKYRI